MSGYNELKTRADQRWRELVSGDKPWIRVGAAMCGHAMGAAEVINVIRRELDVRGVDANVDEVGCLGICYAEPLVDVLKPGSSRVFFRNVRPEDVPSIIEDYVLSGTVPGGK